MYTITIYFEDEDGDLCQIEREEQSIADATTKARWISNHGLSVVDNDAVEWFYGAHRVCAVSVGRARE